jgi:hypothetical protein
VPGFVALEALLDQVAKLISKGRSNMQSLEAARCSNDAPGEAFYGPTQVRLRIVEQLAFGLTSLGFGLSFLSLTPRLINLALDERFDVT